MWPDDPPSMLPIMSIFTKEVLPPNSTKKELLLSNSTEEVLLPPKSTKEVLPPNSTKEVLLPPKSTEVHLDRFPTTSNLNNGGRTRGAPSQQTFFEEILQIRRNGLNFRGKRPVTFIQASQSRVNAASDGDNFVPETHAQNVGPAPENDRALDRMIVECCLLHTRMPDSDAARGRAKLQAAILCHSLQTDGQGVPREVLDAARRFYSTMQAWPGDGHFHMQPPEEPFTSRIPPDLLPPDLQMGPYVFRILTPGGPIAIAHS
ncbi:hypothetical protein PAPYR_8390 [Paratrimastix pyriformis]|uniref:Uncharacterized protein n=1 Tax=Paratrimastix pyriformis TaxID=342808 RepID=A0ABQ8UHY5_9EUKA|nr:hypothetical protein PAPYR_8390 [Paratrimastix pyriformis]